MSQENKMARDFFDKQASETYDQRIKPIAPSIDNLHFLIRLILKDLPSDAHILCVGVGTGTEILELAHTFPSWRFTGIDPSASMLDVCRKRLQQSGLLTRCELRHGYLSDLPMIEQFDAILCLLVAHFIKDSQERQALFNGMAARLKVAGYVIHAEISYDLSGDEFPDIGEKWKALHRAAGASEERVANILKTLQEDVAVLPPASTEHLFRSSGLPMPIPFFQSLLIRAWYAQKMQNR
ncbi:class I SAM-dependent methyltransferase [Candidatus Nitrospira nitrificans]|uniref:Methyltransferase domain protein n=1 Tax=Candidatus Nitrospira nitrificans TaxID=1742973 RepID=A0A0S4LP98_9BACT|nr:class I SAM-dependent methyltransferase [Candidatus Nitrospira nitrificans]CUS38734.1 Methyltransferase domain protein [Candidatus Nitrospira nitrificans]